jgi:ankyrin repeat protein
MIYRDRIVFMYFVALFLVAIQPRLASSQQTVPTEVRERLDREFAAAHPQPNDLLPDLLLTNLQGQERNLHASNGELVVLVTASYTCPKTRQNWKGLVELKNRFGTRLGIVVVYVVEAHPENDVCPYLGVVDVTDANVRDNILFRQPQSWDERTEIAKQFANQFKIPGSIFVDSIDNLAWRALGKSPNMALLVDKSQRVTFRQGWFDPVKLEVEIQKWFDLHPVDQPSRSRDNSAGSNASGIKGGMGTSGMGVRDNDAEKRDPVLMEVLRKLDSNYPSEWNLVRWLESVNESKLQTFCDRYPSLMNTILTYGAHDHQHSSVLQLIIARGDLAKVKIVLKAGADVNLHVHDSNAMGTAINSGRLEIVDALIKQQADLKAVIDREKVTLLHFAVLQGQPRIASRLVEAGLRPDFLADCALGNLNSVRKTLNEDSSRGLSFDVAGNSPLACAVRCNQPEVVQLLIETNSTYVNSRSRADSPVKLAVGLKETRILKMLLDAGLSADIDQPIFEAIERRSTSHLELLLKAKPNLTASKHGRTALHLVCSTRCPIEMLRLLIEYGADLDVTTIKYSANGCGPTDSVKAGDETALHLASRDLNADYVSLLIEKGAKLEKKDAAAKTALATAILHTFLAAVDWDESAKKVDEGYKTIAALVDGGCNVDCQDSDGNTILASLIYLQNHPSSREVKPLSRLTRLHPPFAIDRDYGYGPPDLDSKLLFGKDQIDTIVQILTNSGKRKTK